MTEKENPWLYIKQAVKKKIDKNSFETWFDPTVFIGQEKGSLYVKVPNSYFKDWLSFHYSRLINTCSMDIYSKAYNIK